MKTAMQELLESIPNAYEIKMFISENDADEKMLDEFLFERIYKNKNWLEKEKEQIENAFYEAKAESGFRGKESINAKKSAEEYYEETFKN